MYFDFVKKEDYQDDNILFEELLVLSEESFQVLKETYNDKVSYFDKVFQLNDLYEKERLKSAEEYCAVVNDFTLRKENLSLFNSVQTLIIYMDEIRSKYLYDKVDAKLHQKKFVTVEQYVKDNIELEYNMMPYYIDYMEKGISTLPADLLFNLELSNEEEQIDNLTNEEWDLLTSEITEAM